MADVYLDYNATAPVRPEAVRAMTDVLAHAPGNPSSTHAFGAAARAALARARKQVADALGVAAEAIVFTSGATEANNTVLRQAARGAPGPRRPPRDLRDRAPLGARRGPRAGCAMAAA